MSNRLGWVVGALVAVLVALSAVAVRGLVLLGSPLLAGVVAVGGLAAVAAVVAAYAMAREVDAQWTPEREPLLPLDAEPLSMAMPAHAIGVREAKPGEIPEAYLTAVMKGAQATRAALKARAQQAGL
jgi:hypothetical protein